MIAGNDDDDDDDDVSEQSVTSTAGGGLEVLTGPSCVTLTFTADCVTVKSDISVNTTTVTCITSPYVYRVQMQ